MKNLIVVLLILICGIAVGIMMTRFILRTGNQPSIRHESAGAVLERIQRLASLVTLRIPITDIQVTTLSGRTGSSSLVLIIRGDVQVITDLQQAEFEDVDPDRRRVTLLLPAPVLDRPRLDWERSQVYRIDRGGLWKVMPGQAGETELINAALRQAQRRLIDATSRADLIAEAKTLTANHLNLLFASVGWRIEVRWMDNSSTR